VPLDHDGLHVETARKLAPQAKMAYVTLANRAGAWIVEGHFGHHVRRMRQTYSERMSVLREAARKHLNGLLDVTPAAGMRTLAWLETRASDKAAVQRAQMLGLELTALSTFTMKYSRKPAFILGFAGSNPSELCRGVSVLAATLKADTRS
jgi:GntR family transcriptional regulator / MocR family aminotransferase